MRCRRHGATRADVVMLVILVLGVVWLFLFMLLPAYQRKRWHDNRLLCGRNLAGIGKAIAVYANDYDGGLPITGGPGTAWGPGLRDWKAHSRAEAFGLDPNGIGGAATVSASLYLLVKYAGMSPESFVCRWDKGAAMFRPGKYGVGTEKLSAFWDFGPDPARHCSYAYHLPYGPYRVTTSSEGNMVVAADRNPWIDGPREKAREFSLFQPDLLSSNGTTEQALQGNARSHNCDGQNVMYLDGHVQFAKRAFCGLEDDNVYTSWDGRDRVRGVPPKPYESQPAHEHDSLLVNDPPLER